MSARDLDIVLVGATGFTGELTCEYLKKAAPQSLKWGVAGRSEENLKKLKEKLNLDVPSFVIDINRPETLDTVFQKSTVVLSCAGPFTNVGMPVVDACVRNGTHYVDSTGEFNFVRQVCEKYHEEAKNKNLCMVSCCGVDSVPSDVGNFLIHTHAKEPVVSVSSIFHIAMGGFSSGTMNSIGALMENSSRKDFNPCSLNPPDAPAPVAARTRLGIWYDSDERIITAPFPMAGTNERVVRRSNALSGRTGSYSESMATGIIGAVLSTLSLYVAFPLFSVKPIRSFILNKFFPQRSGPDERSKESQYTVSFNGLTETGKKVKASFTDNRGMYTSTGVFLGECAMECVALAKSKKIVPGVTTPTFAFGSALVERLKKAGIKIDVSAE